MREQIHVIFENGVFRPLQPVPPSVQEQQRLTVTIEGQFAPAGWLADANPQASLDEVRRALSKIAQGGIDLVKAEREER